MSQLERQYDELEEVGRNIESALRDAEDCEIYIDLVLSVLIHMLPYCFIYRCSRGPVDEVLAQSCE